MRCILLKVISRSQNWALEGNGVHFMFEVVSRLLFSEEFDGADHFLVHEYIKALLFDTNIFSIKTQQLLCFGMR